MAIEGSAIGSLLSSFGVGTDTLKNARYNGYEFVVLEKSIVDQIADANLGIISDAVATANSLVEQAKSIVGTPNSENKSLIPNVRSGLYSNQESYKHNIVIDQLPNGGTNIRNLGISHQTIEMYGLLTGSNYKLSLNKNFEAMFFSPYTMSRDDPDYEVLFHPIRGRSYRNVKIVSLDIAFIAQKWQTFIWKLTFVTSNPFGTEVLTLSRKDTILQNISSILSIIDSITGFISSVKLSLKNGSYLGILGGVFSQVIGIINSIKESVKSVTNNLAPKGFRSLSLEKSEVDKTKIDTNIVDNLIYTDKHYTPQDINLLIKILNTNANNTIIELENVKFENYVVLTNLIKSSMVTTSNLFLSLLNSYYGDTFTYTVPNNMSLFTVCYNNNLDYDDNYSKILGLNQDKQFWLNKIPQGFKLILPKA
jgi:hypothetical protein